MDDQKAGTGHRGQFWLNTGAALTRLNQAKKIKLPTSERGEVSTTHLDSDAEEFAPTLPDFGEFDVVFNHRDGSDTDLALAAAAASPDARAFKIVVPIRGAPAGNYTGTAFLKKYELPELEYNSVQESTATFRMSGPLTRAAAA